MNRLQFLQTALLSFCSLSQVKAGLFNNNVMKRLNEHPITVRLLRNATIFLQVGKTSILVDPMLSEQFALDPIPWTNNTRNPTVNLPLSKDEVDEMIRRADYVLLTHLHPDHWDRAAQNLIPHNKPIICQPEDRKTLHEQGFSNLFYQDVTRLPEGITISRVAAQHGHGELAEKMAPVSGFVLTAGNKTCYIAGDTVWYEGVRNTLAQYQPDVVIVNGGGAKFQAGEPITMTADDILQVVQHAKPGAKTIVVHMEAVNHCYEKRTDLRKVVEQQGMSSACLVPEDGEKIKL